MNKIKNIISVILVMVILCSCYFSASAYDRDQKALLKVAFKDGLFTKNGLKPSMDFDGEEYSDYKKYQKGDWKYIIRNGKVVITNYTGNDKDLVFPNKIDGKIVEGVERAECEFGKNKYYTNYNSVYIPKNFKYFRLSLENDYEDIINCIESDPEDKCIFSSNKMYYGVYSIFSFPITTKKYIVDKNNKVFYSKDGVLYTKNKKTLLNYPDLKKKKKFVVPNFVRKINQDAFVGNDFLKTIVFGKKIEKIYSEGNYSLKKIYIYGKNTKLYGCNGGHSAKVKYGDPFYERKIQCIIDTFNVYCKKDSIAYKVYKRRQKYQKKDESLKVKIHIIK